MPLCHRQCGPQGHAVPDGEAWQVQGSIFSVKATLWGRFVPLGHNQCLGFLAFKEGGDAMLLSLREDTTLGL